MDFLKSLFKRESGVNNSVDGALTFDESGFFLAGSPQTSVLWNEILRITSYKVDLLTVDQIRVAFAVPNGLAIVISEDQSGFKVLMEELERRFPSVVGWHAKVALPPFAASDAVLYEAPSLPACAKGVL